jgi:SAM-dependent methyltransferase
MNDAVTYDGRDLEVLAEMPRYYDWILHHFQEHVGGKAIEFGAGTGTISKRLLPFVTELELVEPSPNLAQHLQVHYRDVEHVSVSQQTLEQKIRTANKESYESVVAVNLLEHIEDDLGGLRGFYRLLKPGGKLCLFVPAMPCLMSELDREFGHFRRYSRVGLSKLLVDAGFSLKKMRYMDCLGILPWLIVYRWGGSVKFNPNAVKLYDSVGIPVTRALEGLISPAIGKNIVAIAQKPTQ